MTVLYRRTIEEMPAIRQEVEARGDQVADLHYWAVAPGRYALILSVVSDDPDAANVYRRTLADIGHFAHLNVEVWRRQEVGHK